MPSFSDMIKSLRKSNNLTQTELAEALTRIGEDKITRSAIGMWESGQRKPKYEVLETIADYFNVDMDYLLGRNDGRKPASDDSDPELPEITLIARAGKKMSPDQRDLMLRWARMTFPEAFEEDDK